MAEFRKISGSRLMSFVDPITGKTIGSWYPKTPVPNVPTPSVPPTPKWEMFQPSWMRTPSTFSPSLLTPPPPPLEPPRQRKPFYTEGGFLTGVGVGALVVVVLTFLRRKKDSA